MGRFGFGTRPAVRRRTGGVVPSPPPAPPSPSPPPSPPPTQPPVILAVIAGQSNAEGRPDVAREAQDTATVAGAAQFHGDSTLGNYRTITAQVAPLNHYASVADGGGTAPFGPGEYLARQLIADNPTAQVLLVPVARGSTTLVTGGTPQWASNATAGAGGYLFENMISQTNLAYSAAQSAYPGRPIQVVMFWCQGEFDADNGVGRAAYATALTNLIARFRARATGAANAIVVNGSMVPEKWLPTSGTLDPNRAVINAAQVDVSLATTGVRYAMGPLYVSGNHDYLHYQPTSRIRAQGLGWGLALSDTTGPTMTSAAAFSNTVGDRLSIALAANDVHQTFHLNGGANAASFEISDPYLNPRLRWVGDGTGPAQGSYGVGVRARDGAGNYGPTQTLTITAAAPSQTSPASFFTASEKGIVWDLSDPATLFQDTAGTVAVTAAGQPVGRVRDTSPNANHWIATSNAARPTYQVDGNGKPYLAFDGIDDELQALVIFAPDSAKFTATVGLRGPAVVKELGILTCGHGKQGEGNGDMYLLTAAPADAKAGMYFSNSVGNGSGTQPSIAGVYDDTPRVMTTGFAGHYAKSRIRSAASRPAGGGTGGYAQQDQVYFPEDVSALQRTTLGANAFSGNGPQYQNAWFTGRIYSGFVINRFLTDAEVKAGEDWVADRSGLSLP